MFAGLFEAEFFGVLPEFFAAVGAAMPEATPHGTGVQVA